MQSVFRASLLFLLAPAALAAPPPTPVSPAGAVADPCPTFSWSLEEAAGGYEVVIYRVDARGVVADQPDLTASLPPRVQSWTPPGDRCLAPGGRYAWSIRTVGGEEEEIWSEATLIEVSAAPTVGEIEAALATLRRHLAVARDEPAAAPSGPGGRAEPDARAAALEPAGLGPEPRSRPAGAPRAAKEALTLGTASLTLSDQIHLGAASDVFKDGSVFLWDDTSGNTALGRSALASTAETASYNTASGALALHSNTSGHRNTAVGFRALYANTSGQWNTAIGSFALRENVVGSHNTVIGYRALRNGTGDGNVAIGDDAGLSTTDGDDNIYISNAGGSEDSGTIRIGSIAHDHTYIAGIHGSFVSGALNEMAVLVDTSGHLGTQTSSRRFKEAIANIGEVSEQLLELRPVRFRYKEQEGKGPEQYGLLAEEVAEVFPELVVEDEDGDPFSVRYHVMVPLLLNELQRQQARITELEERQTPAETTRRWWRRIFSD